MKKLPLPSSEESCKFKYRKGFTLAEILISLLILGVIASLTIPSLIQKNQEREMITKLKKFYSTIQNATIMAMQNETMDNTLWTNSDNVPADNIFKHIATSQTCKGSDLSCSPNVQYKTLTGTDSWYTVYQSQTGPRKRRYILMDGTFVSFNDTSAECSTNRGLYRECADVWVDLNGPQGPNKFGIDLFMFFITEEGKVLPTGSDGDSYTLETCNKEDKSDESNGLSCTAWAVVNGNMDYLRHSVSWDE